MDYSDLGRDLQAAMPGCGWMACLLLLFLLGVGLLLGMKVF